MDMVHAVQAGEHFRLKVRRKGEEHLVDIVAGAPKWAPGARAPCTAGQN